MGSVEFSRLFILCYLPHKSSVAYPVGHLVFPANFFSNYHCDGYLFKCPFLSPLFFYFFAFHPGLQLANMKSDYASIRNTTLRFFRSRRRPDVSL